VLAACPPDRDHDITSLTARRRELVSEMEPLLERQAELGDRKLRGPGTRAELRDLRERLEQLAVGAERLDAELDYARHGSGQRQRFLADHAGDATRLRDIDSQIDRHVEAAVAQAVQSPSEYTLGILGPVPTRLDHREHWMKGATILERQRVGLDSHDDRGATGIDGRNRAEMRARFAVIVIPRAEQGVERTIEPDLGLDLF
jgi:hypothetical protein